MHSSTAVKLLPKMRGFRQSNLRKKNGLLRAGTQRGDASERSRAYGQDSIRKTADCSGQARDRTKRRDGLRHAALHLERRREASSRRRADALQPGNRLAKQKRYDEGHRRATQGGALHPEDARIITTGLGRCVARKRSPRPSTSTGRRGASTRAWADACKMFLGILPARRTATIRCAVGPFATTSTWRRGKGPRPQTKRRLVCLRRRLKAPWRGVARSLAPVVERSEEK